MNIFLQKDVKHKFTLDIKEPKLAEVDAMR